MCARVSPADSDGFRAIRDGWRYPGSDRRLEPNNAPRPASARHTQLPDRDCSACASRAAGQILGPGGLGRTAIERRRQFLADRPGDRA